MASDPAFPANLLKDELLRRLPIDLDTTESFGPITEVWVDPRGHRVIGGGCGGGLGRRSRRFAWGQVVSIGHDGLVLRATTDQQVEAALADGFVLGEIEVWSDYGDRLGHLINYRFDPSQGTILQYHFTTVQTVSALVPGTYAIPPETIISLGRRRMMVAHTALAQAERLGDPTPLRPAGHRSPLDALPLDQVLDHMPDPKQTWDTTVDKTRQASTQLGTQISEQWQEQGQKLQAQAQQRVGHWLGDVKKRTRRLRHQLRETVSDVTAGLPTPPPPRRGTPPTIDVDAIDWDDDPSPPQR